MKAIDKEDFQKGLSNGKKSWISSKETRKILKITTCELMHMRHAGLISFRKKGNAYEYLVSYNGD